MRKTYKVLCIKASHEFERRMYMEELMNLTDADYEFEFNCEEDYNDYLKALKEYRGY